MRSSTLAWIQRLCCFATCLLSLAVSCGAAADRASLPKPTGYVSDTANVVSRADQEQLEAFCRRVESELGVEFAFVTVDTIGDAPIRDYALKLFRLWGVGDRKTNQGVLLLLAIKDHKSDIETGRGIEPYLTDGFSGSTLRSMRPDLRSSQYGPALLSAAHAMAKQIAQGKNIAFADEAAPDLGPRVDEPQEPSRSRRRGGGGFPFVLIVIVLLLWLMSRGGRRGGGGGAAGSFLTGMLLGNLLGGGRRYDGGGNWGGGGGFGGGDSGGGFGGFGGGDAGGGGASSDW